jgi:hypothetical protein
MPTPDTRITEREPQKLRYIGLEEDWEVQWWAVRLGVTADDLREAVRQHGNDAQVVEQRLKEAARKSLRNMGR